MNYYQDNNPFLQPSVHYLGADGTGKTISECPLIYYSVASLWKVFGHHEFIYRMLVLLIYFIGLFSVFKLFENKLKDSIWAMICSLLLFTSPTLVYYANNFLMDIPALSLAMVGLYFFFRFEQSGSNKFLYWSALFYTIAGLLKVSALLSFAAIIGLFALELVNVTLRSDRKVFHQPLKQAAVFAGVLLIQYAWYSYASFYNAQFNSGNFLIGILPIWEMDSSAIQTTLSAIGDHMQWSYFRLETQILLLLTFSFIIVFFKRANKAALYLTLIASAGFCAYVVLFFNPLKDHDYYTVNLFILVPIVLLTFFDVLKTQFSSSFSSIILKVLAIAFLIHNVDFARRRMIGRYNPDGWTNANYTHNLRAFTEIEPYLEAIGVRPNERVISLSDDHINTSLYLMNHKGWTNYGIYNDMTRLQEKIDQGAKYLFISDTTTYAIPGIESFTSNKVGQYKNIDIYAL